MALDASSCSPSSTISPPSSTTSVGIVDSITRAAFLGARGTAASFSTSSSAVPRRADLRPGELSGPVLVAAAMAAPPTAHQLVATAGRRPRRRARDGRARSSPTWPSRGLSASTTRRRTISPFVLGTRSTPTSVGGARPLLRSCASPRRRRRQLRPDDHLQQHDRGAARQQPRRSSTRAAARIAHPHVARRPTRSARTRRRGWTTSTTPWLPHSRRYSDPCSSSAIPRRSRSSSTPTTSRRLRCSTASVRSPPWTSRTCTRRR